MSPFSSLVFISIISQFVHCSEKVLLNPEGNWFYFSDFKRAVMLTRHNPTWPRP